MLETGAGTKDTQNSTKMRQNESIILQTLTEAPIAAGKQTA